MTGAREKGVVMRSEKFVEMLGLMPEGPAPAEASERLREQLDASGRYWFHDVSGDGTRYETNGRRHGIAFARGIVELRPDGLVVVRVETGQRVAPELERATRKLFSCYSSRLKVPGLAVEDGRAVFVTAPFDALEGRRDVEEVLGLALSTVHAFAGVMLALDAGAEPWTLIDYDEPGDGGDDDGGEAIAPRQRVGSEPGPDFARELRRRLEALVAQRRAEDEAMEERA